MSKNGENLILPAPYAALSGGGVKTSLIFGVAAGTAANCATVDLVTVGVFDLAKVSTDAFSIGAAVHSDDTAKLCTSTASGNQKIGVAVAAAAKPSGTVAVRLNGTF